VNETLEAALGQDGDSEEENAPEHSDDVAPEQDEPLTAPEVMLEEESQEEEAEAPKVHFSPKKSNKSSGKRSQLLRGGLPALLLATIISRLIASKTITT